ncbi:MAG: hypothetical protein DRN49_00270 [Thaumarchaeota archaeon]|nr:MAG: hypothetical protein DRN49_00270 [Nitrososphaerota archaeon]
MNFKPLEAIIPIDGRYRERVADASRYFSEYALIKERLRVEIEFLVKIIETCCGEITSKLPQDWKDRLLKIIDDFKLEDAEEVKELEKILGHDVKALMDYLRKRLHRIGLEQLSSYIHLGLTSDDVNNLAYSLLLSRFRDEVLVPNLIRVIRTISEKAKDNLETIMLGRTHGVPAVPTTFGRFLSNYAYRLARITYELAVFKFPGKLGGAVGDHSALKFTYPEVDWIEFSKGFVESLGLEYIPASTQILPHDKISEFLGKISILDAIASNLCRDLWLLSSLGLLVFGRRVGETHSSTMPHKSNPLHLENAEGAFDLASSIASFMARRLVSSRLHRDLSDSIIKRFYGLPLTLTIIGFKSLMEAFKRMNVLRDKMKLEVESHPESLTEAYQVYLRAHGVEDAYELVQGAFDKGWSEILKEIKGRGLSSEVVKRLREAKPSEYFGEAIRIGSMLLDEVEKILGRLGK